MDVQPLSNREALRELASLLQELLMSFMSRGNLSEIKLPFSFLLSGFEVNSSILTNEQLSILDDLSVIILASQANTSENTVLSAVFEIDELIGRSSQTGNERNNINLSRSRAESVRQWLDNNGFYSLPSIVAKGSSDPIVDANYNELAINRSVEIKLLALINLRPLSEELSHWEDVFKHKVPTSIIDSLTTRNIYVQSLETAESRVSAPLLNLDFYQVRVIQMPKKSNGSLYTIDELFREIRLNMSSIITSTNSAENKFKPNALVIDDSSILGNVGARIAAFIAETGADADFGPYDLYDEVIWLSANPLGAVMKFDTYGDDMGVVCSTYANSYWIFSTVGDNTLPLREHSDLGTHPVSGNRKFGYFQDASGHFVLYTQGTDRTTGNLESFPGMRSMVFAGGNIIWLSWQVGVQKFIEERGGSAAILRPISNQEKSYENVRDFFYP